MKTLHIANIILCILFCAGCDKDNEAVLPVIKPEATGEMIDARDGFNYHWVRYNGLDWTVENAHYQTTEGTYAIYTANQILSESEDETNSKTLAKYGYLYTYQGALEAAPDGWRVPTDDDWKKLEKALGMSSRETEETGWRGKYAAELMKQGEEGTSLNFLYAGYWIASTSSYASQFHLMGAYGLYWSSTEDTLKSNKYAYYRKFLYNSPQVFRYSTDKANMLSIRFVRDSDSNTNN
ncbi:MAG: hypothetical protein H6Q13_31 [Bacteroidetes bacterium]|nr:hypothetical protein [Bacteroidota bacterium]